MPAYETLYALLFNAITDALRAMEEMDMARAHRVLVDAQRRAEELYVGDGEF